MKKLTDSVYEWATAGGLNSLHVARDACADVTFYGTHEREFNELREWARNDVPDATDDDIIEAARDALNILIEEIEGIESEV